MTIQKLTLDEHYAELNKPGRYDAIRAGEAPIHEVDSETYHQFLEVMPPKGWERADGVERFMVCEAICDTPEGMAYQMYATRDGRYYTKTVIGGIRETYLTADTLEAAQ